MSTATTIRRLELEVDVTEATGLGELATVALTVHLPAQETLAQRPVVCFAKPGGGYSRAYYTASLPGPNDSARSAEADWHATRGWVFVSIDHLGVGGSSTHHDPARLSYTPIAAANHAAELDVLRRLADGTLAQGFPALTAPLKLGIGQSMGGALTVVQQARHQTYDGIAVLGYSAVHTHPPTAPGTPTLTLPWVPRDATPELPVIVNGPALAISVMAIGDPRSGPAMAWGFHYDDIPAEVIETDMTDFPTRCGHPPEWASATLPLATALWSTTPGAIAPEAASITVPVLVALRTDRN